MARNKEQYQEVYSRILKVLTKQDITYKKDKGTLPIENALRNIVGN